MSKKKHRNERKRQRAEETLRRTIHQPHLSQTAANPSEISKVEIPPPQEDHATWDAEVPVELPDRLSFRERMRRWTANPTWRDCLVAGGLFMLPKCGLELVELLQKSHWIPALEYEWIKILLAVLHLPSSILYEFGIALVVFAFVSITIERFAKGEMLREHAALMATLQGKLDAALKAMQHKYDEDIDAIKDNVFSHMLKLVVRDDVLDYLKATIFSQTLYRSNIRLRFTFNPCPNDDERQFVVVVSERSYRLENNSAQPKEYRLSHSFDTLPQHKSVSRVLSFVVNDGTQVIGRLGAHNHSLQITESDEGNKHFVGTTVVVQRDRPLDVRVRFETVRRVLDSDGFITRLPSDSLELEVELHKDVNLEFNVDCAHSSDTSLVDESNESKTYRCSVPGPLLAGHGVILSWHPTTTQTPGASP